VVDGVKRAGCPGKLTHDFRRTTARNKVNSAVSERAAMKATGHRSRSILDRYHIVSPGDLQDVARKLPSTFQGTSGGQTVSAVDATVRS